MFLYRIVKKKFATNIEQVFDGEGARRYGGRWNSAGNRCVYLATSESLAILEVLVHLNDTELLNDYDLYRIDIDEALIIELDQGYLPDDWQEDPAPSSTAQIGDEWLESEMSLCLKIPSTIVPREFNCLLNLQHAAFNLEELEVVKLAFNPDHRLSR
ncbi:RES family NAD+ phosphorylase [Vibrio maritimus]|uniref:RES family NAD+ phosphorylase n=1 Tax=Vibrio maritimus TaxID=990268 RepID=UPI001F176C1D|nr:RES domain-containing protein [Vibrio maritimus]